MDDRMLLMAKALLPGFPPNLRPLILALLHMMELQRLMQHFQEDNKLLHKEQSEVNMEDILFQMMGNEGSDMMNQAKQFMDMMEMMNYSEETDEHENL